MFNIDKEKCAGCGICLNVCPVEAISMVEDKAEIDEGKCIECGKCAQVCPKEAIYYEVEQQRVESSQYESVVSDFNNDRGRRIRGMRRGLGRGKGRGLGRGPSDGRGRG